MLTSAADLRDAQTGVIVDETNESDDPRAVEESQSVSPVRSIILNMEQNILISLAVVQIQDLINMRKHLEETSEDNGSDGDEEGKGSQDSEIGEGHDKDLSEEEEEALILSLTKAIEALQTYLG